jgi:flagellar protein FlbD
MIVLTRINDRKLVVNAELIKTIEETPDTTLTLVNGERLLVKESMDEVVRRAVDYARQVRTFAVRP